MSAKREREENSSSSTSSVETKKQKTPVRVWIDGCFDLWHYGHANALRQAKLSGDIVVAGIHSDQEIKKHKGLPVMNNEERRIMVESCKWVDEVVENAPYETQLNVLKQHNITFAVHGEDISTNAQGQDSFHEVKKAGMFRYIKRTQGVSTTDIVSRLLLATRAHHQHDDETIDGAASSTSSSNQGTLGTRVSESQNSKEFLTTSRKIVDFSSKKIPKPADCVVYCDGAFDLFHAGHVSFLKKAREQGDFLIVGLHKDKDINLRKGCNHPVMNLHERSLALLSCKYVDEVIIGTPIQISDHLIDSLHIDVVVHGGTTLDLLPGEQDPYKVPKAKGIYKVIKSGHVLDTSAILNRIIRNRMTFEQRNEKKTAKDASCDTQRKTIDYEVNGPLLNDPEYCP
eukprot:CAMPEP_0201551514 /NCGR_PEP_ID=MMETSP0173_2-20130828/7677_1 /ASSEMBLY_ACC=CAM_ASM_000268 /TAXON_ID=218659 /ORGANISM="Vexillifera sp., Strain DIVA3 564/2" /LENGTH=398 /DNA_ID=CAMNT_0047961793 /DNA_START=15 /DNA_END=1211 /DNA_ORIENTATION=-